MMVAGHAEQAVLPPSKEQTQYRVLAFELELEFRLCLSLSIVGAFKIYECCDSHKWRITIITIVEHINN